MSLQDISLVVGIVGGTVGMISPIVNWYLSRPRRAIEVQIKTSSGGVQEYNCKRDLYGLGGSGISVKRIHVNKDNSWAIITTKAGTILGGQVERCQLMPSKSARIYFESFKLFLRKFR